MIIKQIVGFVGFVFITMGAYAQDPQFSQFYSNPLYMAPSFAGLSGETRIGLNYRLQWPQMPGAYNTYSVSVDHAINAFNSGLGLYIMKDKAGSGGLSLSNISLQYAYTIKINEEWRCIPGISVSYLQRSIDPLKLVWRDQITSRGTSNVSSESLPMEKVDDMDFGTSVVAYSDKFWFGASADHIFQPDQSFYLVENSAREYGYIPVKYSVFGGTKIINKGRLFRPYDTSLQLAFMFRKQKFYKQLDLGLYWYNKPFVVGFWYRGIPVIKPFLNQDALTILAGYKNENFSLGYSYDFTISKLVGSTGGAHEISLSYSFKAKTAKSKGKMVPCPDF